jgi:hypothetical protein
MVVRYRLRFIDGRHGQQVTPLCCVLSAKGHIVAKIVEVLPGVTRKGHI